MSLFLTTFSGFEFVNNHDFSCLNSCPAKSTGGSVVEFSPATREARVRLPANVIFLYAPFLFSFTINSLWSSAFHSWLGFLRLWWKLVSTKRKKSFPAAWSDSHAHLVKFCSLRLRSCLVLAYSSSWSWKWFSSSAKHVLFIKKNTTCTSIVVKQSTELVCRPQLKWTTFLI